MQYNCGHCLGRHDTVDQVRACSIEHLTAPSPRKLRPRDTPNVQLDYPADVVAEVMETRGEHTLTGYEGAGVHKRNRLLAPWTGTCTCGEWAKTYGDKATLVTLWRVHAGESSAAN